MATPKAETVTRAQEIYFSWTIDILVYIVVLNLFVEYLPSVIIESFTVSILTAILLKAMLEIITRLELRVLHWFKQREGRKYWIVGLIIGESIIFIGKIVILLVVDLVFEEDVQLGGLIEVIVLVVAMVVVRYLMHWIYLRLGRVNSHPQEAPSD